MKGCSDVYILYAYKLVEVSIAIGTTYETKVQYGATQFRIFMGLLAYVSHTTVGQVSIAWFNDCILGKKGQIANPIIANVDPVLYYSIIWPPLS